MHPPNGVKHACVLINCSLFAFTYNNYSKFFLSTIQWFTRKVTMRHPWIKHYNYSIFDKNWLKPYISYCRYQAKSARLSYCQKFIYTSCINFFLCIVSFFSSLFVTMGKLWSMATNTSTSVCQECSHSGSTLDLASLILPQPVSIVVSLEVCNLIGQVTID